MSEEKKEKEAKEAKGVIKEMDLSFAPYFDRDKEVAIQMLRMAIDLLTKPTFNKLPVLNKED